MSRSDSVGDVAQLVEQGIHKPRVTGSSPVVAMIPASTPVAGGFFNGCIGCTGCSAADSRDDAPWAGLAGITGVDCVDDGLLTRFSAGQRSLSESPTMRIVIDIMIGLMVVAAISGGLYLYHTSAQSEQQIDAVRDALAQLEKQAAYHTAVQSAMADQDVMLVHIDKRWFGEDVPVNVLLEGDRPWIDLAPPGDLGVHPPDPVVYSESQASFWYNPTTGTFRARVAPAASEATTLALYNKVNGSVLNVFDVIPDTSRTPVAHTADKTPARQYASMANKTWSEATAEKEELATDLLTAEPTVDHDEQAVQVVEPFGHDFDQPADDSRRLIDAEKGSSEAEEADSKNSTRPTLQNLAGNQRSD